METTQTITKTKWVIDPMHSQVGFKVKHLVFSNVRGTFKKFEADIYSGGEDFTNAEISFRIDPASITTGDEQRDAHLRSEDFFDAKNFREIHFIATAYEKAGGNGKYELTGDLTMKGITKQVKLDVEFGGMVKDPWGNQKAIFSISGKINRKDWGLNWNAALEAGGVLVSEDTWISCELQLTKQS